MSAISMPNSLARIMLVLAFPVACADGAGKTAELEERILAIGRPVFETCALRIIAATELSRSWKIGLAGTHISFLTDTHPQLSGEFISRDSQTTIIRFSWLASDSSFHNRPLALDLIAKVEASILLCRS